MTTKPVRVSKHMPDVVPSCFNNKEEFEAWREMSRRKPPAGDNWICGDCLRPYQAKMTAVGRCAYPDRDLGAQEVEDDTV